MAKTVFVAGASGLTGQALVHLLVKNDEIGQVVCLGRSPLPFSHPKIVSYVVDFENISSEIKGGHADVMYCCLGTTIKKAKSQAAFEKVDKTFVLDLARFAKESKILTFAVVSSIGANAKSSNFYLRTKGLMEQELMRIGIPHTLVFRPSILVGKRTESRLLEKLSIIVMQILSPLMVGPLKNYRPTKVTRLARAMIETSFQKNGSHIIENKEINGFIESE